MWPAPMDHLQQLCDLALELNASYSGDRAADAAALPRRGAKVVSTVTDAAGGNGLREEEQNEGFAREKDAEVLEAASCVVRAERGDALLLWPDLFHRTQNIAVDRVAFNAEAF